MPGTLKTASFTVRATSEQSVRWKRAADAEGFASGGAWLARAADAYLRVRARAGLPMPLAWHKGRFSVLLEGGETVPVPGFVSPPFGAFRGSAAGRGLQACKRYTLVHVPSCRIIATLYYLTQCKALASELAPAYARDEAAALPIVDRHRREAV